MPSLKDTKRRIASVKNTQKITHAMKLVSAAKFARANQAVIASRPFKLAFESIAEKILSTDLKLPPHDLLGKGQKTGKNLVVLISSDRGLCGGLNSNLFKAVQRFRAEKAAEGVKLEFCCWGKRAIQFARKNKLTVVDEQEKVSDRPTFARATELKQKIVDLYLRTEYDGVSVAFVEFKTALAQEPRVVKYLPYDIQDRQKRATGSVSNYLIEPKAEKIVFAVIEQYLRLNMFGFLLESYASEQGARMSAMDSATKNAKEVIRKLTLQYNRARQAAITKELIEITSGADAL